MKWLLNEATDYIENAPQAKVMVPVTIGVLVFVIGFGLSF